MGFDQYHEPSNELSQETRTLARRIASQIEGAEWRAEFQHILFRAGDILELVENAEKTAD